MEELKAEFAPDAKGDELMQAYQEALEKGETQAIESAAMAFFDYASEHGVMEPSQDLLWKQKAHEHEAVGEWDEAEAAYCRCLVLAQEQDQPGMVFKANSDLSRLYAFLGRKERALESAEAALEAARVSDMKPLIGMALENCTFCLLNQENIVRALETTEELVQMLSASFDKAYDTQKARALVLRARCWVELRQTAQAEQDLAAALPLLDHLSGVAFLAGVQSGLAHFWEVTARCTFLRPDLNASVAAWQKAVEYRRVVSESDHLEGPYKYAALARSLRKWGKALLSIGDNVGSHQALQESQSIQAAIKQPAVGL